ncbi:MAG: TIGR03752 family integrating conjugative element protein [Candidatus Thiodiazotropha endolucinida]
MAIATSNRLLPLLAGAVVLMLVFVTLKSCSQEPEDALVLESVPQAPAPDADSPADTIKTLTANVASMTTEVQALRKDNDQLRKENRDLLANRHQIEENVTTRVKRELLSHEKDRESRDRIDAGVLSSLTARVDTLSQSLSQRYPNQSGSDIPVGLGLDNVGEGAATSDGLIWVEPLDSVDDAALEANGNSLLQRVGQSTGIALTSATEKTPKIKQALTQELSTVHPVYTVPRNATLIGSTAMTALVGRVPVQGQVRDPMPFKVITGADNLAANGLTVPGVQGMVWSGTAVGDWTLSCVTGRLDSVTFVFEDGTIRTISGDDRGNQGGGAEKPLGWISDEQGIPCITGERKTNAPAFLSQRIGVMAIQAAAEAAANAETTSVVSNAGSVTSSVSGDTGRFVLGKTISGGSEEVSKWLLERQSQSFDAVFVPAGIRIAIHVDRELPIDFDTTGRKLTHETDLDPYRRTRLD